MWMAERPENGTENKVLYDKHGFVFYSIDLFLDIFVKYVASTLCSQLFDFRNLQQKFSEQK
jgi:hypothetical protein